jgi:drug/metabolite transporter (DMT)-like permease
LQIVFTGIPVWTAVIAFFVLGEQPLHTVGIVGALLVLAAGLVIASELE